MMNETELTAPAAPITPTVSISVPPRPSGVLHDHTLPAQVFTVQLVHRIVCVAGVFELHEPVPENNYDQNLKIDSTINAVEYDLSHLYMVRGNSSSSRDSRRRTDNKIEIQNSTFEVDRKKFKVILRRF